MLSTRTEQIIFSVILIVFIFFFGTLAVEYKAAELPINVSVTPDELIQEKYSYATQIGTDYQYHVMGDYLCVLLKHDDGTFDLAYKNERSGFMFTTPGIITGAPYKIGLMDCVLPNGNIVYVFFSKFDDEYVIRIEDYHYTDIDLYNDNGDKLKELRLDNVNTIVWVDLITELKEETEIYGLIDGERISIVNSHDIWERFGGTEINDLRN